jgi:DNA-binding NarL/FixJ family response regulator
VLRCLIVDDSVPFLQAARMLLERDGISVVGVASTSAEALRSVADLQPDVTLVDIDLRGESGFQLARQLETARVILISSHAEDDYADLVAESPAVGFLSKTALSGDAIRQLLSARPGR